MRKGFFILSLMVTTVLSKSVLSANCPVGTTEGVDCWNCGDDCKAYFSDDVINNGKTLNIIGNGNMDDYDWVSNKFTPWDNKKITSAVIQGKNENGSGITSIGAWTFMLATNLKSVSIPDSVTLIEGSAFKGTDSLTQLHIPSSVTSIGSEAFYSTGLENINIPEGVTSIESTTFAHNHGVTNIVLPDTMTSIGDKAFADTGLTSIIIPDTVTSIGEKAFENSQGLNSVTIGSSVTSIGELAFNGIASDAKIYCEDTTTNRCSDLISVNNSSDLSRLQLFIKDADGNMVLYDKNDDGTIISGEKKYASLQDLYEGNEFVPEPVSPAIEPTGDNGGSNNDVNSVSESIFNTTERGKRIYTVQEAKDAAGKKNRVMIRYK